MLMVIVVTLPEKAVDGDVHRMHFHLHLSTSTGPVSMSQNEYISTYLKTGTYSN